MEWIYGISTKCVYYANIDDRPNKSCTRLILRGAESRITYESIDTVMVYNSDGTYYSSYEQDAETYYLDLNRYYSFDIYDYYTGYQFLKLSSLSTWGNTWCWAEVSYLQDEQDLAPYTLYIYDKNGKDILKQIDVASGAAPASYDLPKGTELNRDGEFNNDAIKIRIEPQTSDNAASEDLDYEALDLYLTYYRSYFTLHRYHELCASFKR